MADKGYIRHKLWEPGEKIVTEDGEYVFKRAVGYDYMEQTIVVTESAGNELCATLVGPFWRFEVPAKYRIEGVSKYDIFSVERGCGGPTDGRSRTCNCDPRGTCPWRNTSGVV